MRKPTRRDQPWAAIFAVTTMLLPKTTLYDLLKVEVFSLNYDAFFFFLSRKLPMTPLVVVQQEINHINPKTFNQIT